MKKIIKRDLLLEQTEIDYIQFSISDKIPFNFRKTVEMDIDNKDYKVKLSLCSIDNVKGVKLEIDFIPYDIGVDNFNKFEVEKYGFYYTYQQFMGVKEIRIKNLKIRKKAKFLLNITLDRNSYKSINEYEEEMLNLYNFKNLKKREILYELQYHNFEDDFNMFFCSYLLTKELKKGIFDASSNIFKLYTDKLYFVGIDLKDYKDSKYNFDILYDVTEAVSLIDNAEELKEYLFAYISYLTYYSDESTLNMIEVSKILFLICEKYISLAK